MTDADLPRPIGIAGITSRPSLVWDTRCLLGEGPVWVDRDAALWFVDIKRRQVLRLGAEATTGAVWEAPEEIGFVLPVASGGYVAGLSSGFARFDPSTSAFDAIRAVDADLRTNRLNDATVDSAGRLWFGTMDNGCAAPTGRLYRVDGGVPVDTGIAPTCIVNGPVFSGDGRIGYWADTLAGTVMRGGVDDDGTVDRWDPWVRIDATDGYPDGLAIDAEGCLWIALYAGWQARRYSPEGELLASVEFPVANVTKLAFGGADRRTVFATTARQELDAAALAGQPAAGGLYAFRADVPGIAAIPALL